MAGPYRSFSPTNRGPMPQDLLNPTAARAYVRPQSYTSAYAPAPVGSSGTGTLPGLNSYDNIGKTNVNLVGPPSGEQPGIQTLAAQEGTNIYAKPQVVPQMGAFEGLARGILDSVGGGLPADIREHIANGLGIVANLLDIPAEVIGNLPQIPLPQLAGPEAQKGNLFPSTQQFFGELPETDAKKEAEAALSRDPANALYYMSQYLKYHETEIAHGLGVSPLISDYFVPSNNLGDQVMRTLGLLGLPGRLVERAVSESDWRNATGQILAIDPKLLNPELARIRSEYEAGRLTKTEFYDEITRTGFGFSNDIYKNMVAEIFTDPLLLASFGTGIGLKLAATSGRVAMIGKTVRAANELAEVGKVDRAAMDAYAIAKAGEPFVARQQSLGITEAMKLVRDPDRFEYLEKFHPEISQGVLAGMSSRGRAMVALDPLIQGAASVSRVLNSPFDLYGHVTGRLNGSFRNGERVAAFSSVGSVEGVVQAYGPSRVLKIQNLFDKAGVPDQLKQILGRMGANAEVGVHVDSMGRMVLAKGSVPPNMPDQLIRAQSEVYHSRLALQVEGWMRRAMTQFLPTTRFGKEAIEETMAKVKQISEAKLMKMTGGDVANQAAIHQLVEGADDEMLALIEHMYYGGPVLKTFHDARALMRSSMGDALTAMRKKLATGGAGGGPMVGHSTRPRMEAKIAAQERALSLFDRVTPIGPKTLTWQRAGKILEDINRGDAPAARAAVEQYNELFTNFAAKGLDDEMLLKNLGEFLRQLREGGREKGRLVNELKKDELPREMRDWYSEQADFARRAGDVGPDGKPNAYTVGLAPQQSERWRAVYDSEDNLIGLNAWAESVPDVADTPRVTSLSAVRDRLFRPIRGERQLEEARRDFRRRAVEDYGLSRSQADHMFGAIRKLASDNDVMPRGLSNGKLNDLLGHMGWDDETVQRVGTRGMARLVATAFEGKTMTVGLTQKISGRGKRILSSKPGNNWLGVVAEKLYPMARFSLNPIFLAQEAAEPFFWNLLRGIKPGIHWTKEDLKSFEALRRSGFLGEWADQWEYSPSALLLFGQREAERVAGKGSAIGKISDRFLSEGRKVHSLAELKRLNYIRQNSHEFGFAFKKYIEDTDKSFWDTLVREAGTSDPVRIGNYYWLNKALYNPDAVDTHAFLFDATLPAGIGADAHQMPESLAKFHQFTTYDALQRSIRSGGYDEAKFRAVMTEAGMNPQYIDRAWAMASHIGTQKWWEKSADAYALARGNTREAKVEARTVMRVARDIIKQRSRILGYSEEEYLARQMSRPMEFMNSNTNIPLPAHYQMTEGDNISRAYGVEMLEPDHATIKSIGREARAVSGTLSNSETEMQRLIEEAAAPQMGFNAWRGGLWDELKNKGTHVPQTGHYYRAMSEAEYKAGIEAGTFKPLLGDDLYVTNDPDRLAGGAYGAKGGGYIVEIDPSVQTHETTSRTVAGLGEEAVSSFDSGQITRAWKWDPTAKDHLPVGAKSVSVQPTGETTRITAAAIDGTADGAGRDLIHLAGPGLDYDSLVEMAHNVLTPSGMEKVLLGNRRFASLFHVMANQLPEDVVWRFTRDHLAQPGDIHEHRLRIERSRSKSLLQIQSDIAATEGGALDVGLSSAGEVQDYITNSLGPGSGTDYFNMNRAYIPNAKRTGPPNSGFHMEYGEPVPSYIDRNGVRVQPPDEPTHMFGWYDENGKLVSTVSIRTPTDRLDRAVRGPMEPGGGLQTVDLMNQRLEDIPGLPSVAANGDALPEATVPHVNRVGTDLSQHGKGYYSKLVDYIDNEGTFKWADTTGRGSYDYPGSKAAESWIQKKDKASLAAAREALAARMLAGFSYMSHKNNADPQSIMRTMKSVIESGSGKHKRAVPDAHIAIEQMLDFSRIAGDEINPNWKQRANLESMLPQQVRQVDTINPSMEAARAFGYMDATAIRDSQNAMRHAAAESQYLPWVSRDEMVESALTKGQRLLGERSADETIDAIENAYQAQVKLGRPEAVKSDISPAQFAHMQQKYREFAARANGDALLGRTDWTAADMQAINTARYRQAMKKGMGTDVDSLMDNQFVSMNFELEPHPGTDFAEAFPSLANIMQHQPGDIAAFNEGLAKVQADVGRWWASKVGDISGASVVHVSVGPGKHVVNYKDPLASAPYTRAEASRIAKSEVGQEAYDTMVKNDEWDEYVDDFVHQSQQTDEQFQAYGPQISIVLTGSPESIEAAVLATGSAFQRREVIATSVEYAQQRGSSIANNWDQHWVTDFIIPDGASENAIEKSVDQLWDRDGQDLARMSVVLPGGERAIRVLHEVPLTDERGLDALLPLSETDEIASTGVQVRRGVVDSYRHQVDIPDKGPLMEFFSNEGSFVDDGGKTITKANLSQWEWDSRLSWKVGHLTDPWIRELERLGADNVLSALRGRYRGEALSTANIAYWTHLGKWVEGHRSGDINLPPSLRGWHNQVAPKGGIRGATHIDPTNLDASIFVTKKVRPDTIPHELMHQMVPHMEESMIEAIRDAYSTATGWRKRKLPGGGLSNPQEEWLADEFVKYATTGKVMNSKLQSAFNMMGKLVKEDQHIKKLPEAHPLATKLFNDLLGQPNASLSPAQFNPDEYRHLAMARYLMAATEDQAHKTHYFARGRNLLERSVNHPYLGYYPASYMWGKVLPEMIRFLVKQPFGIQAPMGGYMLASHVSQSLLLQLNTDPDMREFVEKHPQLIRFVQMMLPGTPWDIPVNLPAWMRHTAEVAGANEIRRQAGKPIVSPDIGGQIEDSTSYALGVTRFLGTIGDIGKEFGPKKEEAKKSAFNQQAYLAAFGLAPNPQDADLADAQNILSTP